MTRRQLNALRWATAATVAAMAGILAAELLAMRIPAACRAVLRSRQRAEADYHASERLKL